jgi:hypothetical protein
MESFNGVMHFLTDFEVRRRLLHPKTFT